MYQDVYYVLRYLGVPQDAEWVRAYKARNPSRGLCFQTSIIGRSGMQPIRVELCPDGLVALHYLYRGTWWWGGDGLYDCGEVVKPIQSCFSDWELREIGRKIKEFLEGEK